MSCLNELLQNKIRKTASILIIYSWSTLIDILVQCGEKVLFRSFYLNYQTFRGNGRKGEGGQRAMFKIMLTFRPHQNHNNVCFTFQEK
ncbi:hypothetical protein AFM12_12375 [Jiulongibacter sediminis]|uniref:Uncharacterized protein n=1 Tax=Jiulongibacter sediminis TaxID=1605367 RepID=A0A0P7BBW0_9BACT|nr:hypothetical protein AFM12_12375 [Jiulongibacter sediminis]TBX24182.1 hypothetical protein TK44_12385 [Jiulongibacter sediminis]